jgi:ubiquinone biosynthesis protein COQ9
MSLDDTRRKLLDASLAHVAFDGWSESAIAEGARDLGLSPAEALNAFPGGARELLRAFNEAIDAAMLARLEASGLEDMRVRERIGLALRIRLELLEPHAEAVRRGLSYLALPHNAPLASRLLWRTVDAVWYAAGDTATDYNYYTKRSLLCGVYSATLLYWLNDHSEGHAATWAFLDRRLDTVIRIGGRLGKTVNRLLDLPEHLFHRRPGRPRGPLGARRRRV